MVIHPQPGRIRVDAHSFPQSRIFCNVSVPRTITTRQIKQLLRNPLLRMPQHLRKRKLTCCHLLFGVTFYSGINIIPLLVVLHFNYPVNSKTGPYFQRTLSFAPVEGVEPTAFGFGDRCTTNCAALTLLLSQQSERDSNPQPPGPKPGNLTN